MAGAPAAAPVAIRKQGRWLSVSQVVDHYQTKDRWWTERPVSRDYFKALLEDERVALVFHDLIDGGWYEQRDG